MKRAPCGALRIPANEKPANKSASVFLAELVNAAAGVDDLLLARIKRVAVGTDFDLQIVAQRRTRNECVTASAGNVGLFVFGMDIGFHGGSRASERPTEKVAQCIHATGCPQAKTGIEGEYFMFSRGGAPGRLSYPQILWITVWIKYPCRHLKGLKNLSF